KGTAWYLATQPEPRFYSDFIGRLAETAALHPAFKAPAGVQLALREKENAKFLFVLNHTRETVELNDKALAGRELLGGEDCTGKLSLSPNQVAVLQLLG